MKKSNNDKSEKFILLAILITLILLIFVSSNPVTYDASNPKDSFGNLEVSIQDQHTEIIDLLLNKKLDNLTLLDNYNIDDKFINVSTTGVTPAITDRVCLKEDTAFYQGAILSVSALGGNNYELELDSPLDYPFTINGGCSLTTINLAVDGSVTPQIFSISPSGLKNGTEWDIVRMIIHFEDSSPMDTGTFAGIPALSNGVIFRSVNGITKNLFNAKTNGDFGMRAFDYAYSEKAPAGTYGAFIRRTFGGQSKNGVTIRLLADTDDTFQIIIQDDLTALISFHVIIQGHVVDP